MIDNPPIHHNYHGISWDGDNDWWQPAEHVGFHLDFLRSLWMDQSRNDWAIQLSNLSIFAIESCHLWLIYLVKMVIFPSENDDLPNSR